MKAATFAVALSCAIGSAVSAQEATPAGELILELNRAEDVAKFCRLIFVATNKTPSTLDKMAYEVVVFDDGGIVRTPNVILDFGRISQRKTKVISFEIASAKSCAGISRLLIDHAADCVSGGSTVDICIDRMSVQNRTAIAFE